MRFLDTPVKTMSRNCTNEILGHILQKLTENTTKSILVKTMSRNCLMRIPNVPEKVSPCGSRFWKNRNPDNTLPTWKTSCGGCYMLLQHISGKISHSQDDGKRVVVSVRTLFSLPKVHNWTSSPAPAPDMVLHKFTQDMIISGLRRDPRLARALPTCTCKESCQAL